MLYLFLAVITSVAVATVIKGFEKYRVSSFQAIGVNYIVCIISGFIAIQSRQQLFLPQGSNIAIIHEPWFLSAIVLGIGFVSMFNVFAVSVRKIGLALSTISSKMSVIIPVYFGIILFGDKLNLYKVIGIIFTLLAFYFILKREKNIPFRKLYFFLPLLLFAGNGFNDSLQAYTQRAFSMENDMILTFMIVIYTTALILSLIFFIVKLFINYQSSIINYKRNIIGGIILGIFNFATTFYFLKCIGHYSSVFVFPVFNVSLVSLTALAGIIFFKERLSTLNWLGFILAILAIVVIAFG
jgi:drug/metabolite transporter (DMT)-like permease